MQQRIVLKGPTWPACTWLTLGVAWLLEFTDGDVDVRGAVVGFGYFVIAVVHFVGRDSVLDGQGIKPADWLSRRIKWADVVAVTPSKMALHYKDIELTVRGRRDSVWLKERNAGRDLEAVHDLWLRQRREGADEPRSREG